MTARLTVTVPQAGELLGIGRHAAYAAARAGDIPTLRYGDRVVVPIPRLLELVGGTAGLDPELLRRVGIADTSQVDADASGSDSSCNEPDPTDSPAPTGSPGHHDTSPDIHTTLQAVQAG